MPEEPESISCIVVLFMGHEVAAVAGIVQMRAYWNMSVQCISLEMPFCNSAAQKLGPLVAKAARCTRQLG